MSEEKTIRVRVREDDEKKEILLCFDKNKTTLNELIRRAVSRLGAVQQQHDTIDLFVDYGDSDLVVVEDTSVLFHDDRLVLKQREEGEGPPSAPVIVKQEDSSIPVESDSDNEIADDYEEEEESDFEEEEEEDSSSDDNDDDVAIITPQNQKRRKKSPEATLDVRISERDLPHAPGTQVDEMPDDDYEFQPELRGSSLTNNKADNVVKERIMKLFNMGFHEGSNENEAKRAMKMAQKLMKRHNLSQALLLKEREDSNNNQGPEVLKGGLVAVDIQNLRTGKASLYLRWFSNLTDAIGKAFEISSFKSVSRGVRCRLTFYGIYANCQLAAYAFKTAAERISTMQAEFVPQRKSGVTTSSARLWYAMGISDGLESQAEREALRDEEARRRKLQRARQAESKGEAYEDSDVDVEDGHDDNVESEEGFAFGKVKSYGSQILRNSFTASSISADQTTSAYNQTPSTRLEELEIENEAAIVLADQNEKIQKDVLKEEGIELSSGKRLSRLTSYDGTSFQRGKEDSKEIDLKRRAIRDDWTKYVKKEKSHKA